MGAPHAEQHEPDGPSADEDERATAAPAEPGGDGERPTHLPVDDDSDATSAAPPATTPPLPSE